jgi:hypothetical protein
MKLSAPKEITFIIAVILAILGVLASQGVIHIGHAFGLVVAGFVVLALGNLVKGL